MSKTLYRIKLEATRLFLIRKNLIALLLIAIMGFLSVLLSVVTHKNLQAEKSSFLTHEKNKSQLVADSQYGDSGFRVLLEPTPLIVFFNNSSVFENLYSIVDMTETLKVSSSYKGRNLFLKRGLITDPSIWLFLSGSLLMTFMALTSYKSEKHFFNFGNILIRFVLLELYFLVLAIGIFAFACMLGVNFSPPDQTVFLYFTIYQLGFLGIFYAAGVFIRVLFKRRRAAILWASVFYIIVVFIIPDLVAFYLQSRIQQLPPNEVHNLQKINERMIFERDVRIATGGVKTLAERNKIYRQLVRRFLNAGYIKNSKIERDINRSMKRELNNLEAVLVAFPTAYHQFFSGEAGGKGYRSYIDLVAYTLKLRHNFILYYLPKRYESGGDARGVVPFIKGEGNVFKAAASLPKLYVLATVVTFFYVIAFLTSAYLILRPRLNQKQKKPTPGIQNFRDSIGKGKIYFVLCKDYQYKEELFLNYLGTESSSIGLYQVMGEDIDIGTGLYEMVPYFCKLSGVKYRKALENLREVGIESGDLKKIKTRHRHKVQLSEDDLRLIYCAVTAAKDKDIIVINDFLRGRHKELEDRFRKLMVKLNKEGKTIIYLSTKIFSASEPFTINKDSDGPEIFDISPLNVDLR